MEKRTSVVSLLPVLFGFFVMGFCDIVGISSDYARESFGWSHTMTGFIPSMVFLWFLVVSIPAGIWMNKHGRKNAVLLSMCITLIGMIVPLWQSEWTCLFGYALLGIGNTVLQVSLNPLLSCVVRDERILTSSLTAGQVVKAVSSLCGPLILLFAVYGLGGGDKNNWYYAFPIMGVITLISAVWLWMTPIQCEEKTNDNGVSCVADVWRLLINKEILILFLGIFFVVGIDVATNFIGSKIMIERFGWSVDEAGIAPSVYFICRTVGAFVGVFVMTRMDDWKYFRINIVLALLLVITLVLCSDTYVDMFCIGAIGFTCSCVFPIIYGKALNSMPDKANLISGLLITAVSGGGAVTPLIGVAMDLAGISAGICILLFCAIYLNYCSFYFR